MMACTHSNSVRESSSCLQTVLRSAHSVALASLPANAVALAAVAAEEATGGLLIVSKAINTHTLPVSHCMS